ncbi:MAG: 4-hydroxythreonine-4-phosphate dehydrogenase PdxA [Verrucomicrobiae bacterium]|nr:4-hydroxythreonine-4-phosphate dehydrogenase PdxA [Verrucomicrobiae bacterium]
MIGITLGDPSGIGPEVVAKAMTSLAESDDEKYLIIGDPDIFQSVCAKSKINIPFSTDPTTQEKIVVYNPLNKPIKNLKPGNSEAATAAIEWLKFGATQCQLGKLKALVTAPVNKESIINAGVRFIGQTEFLAEISSAQKTAMMLLGTDEKNRWIRVILATTHVPIKKLPQSLSSEKIELAIEMASLAGRALGLANAKIAVCGLNPHAGEGGKLGDEENNIIKPAIEKMAKRGLCVEGPFAADALFYHHYTGKYDIVIAMYHDQGLAPLKMVAFERGINWTVGLPFIRTSPDHGTAYDIVGKNIASPSSTIAAIKLAQKLSINESYAKALSQYTINKTNKQI